MYCWPLLPTDALERVQLQRDDRRVFKQPFNTQGDCLARRWGASQSVITDCTKHLFQAQGLDVFCVCAEHRHRRGSSPRRTCTVQGHQERRLCKSLSCSSDSLSRELGVGIAYTLLTSSSHILHQQRSSAHQSSSHSIRYNHMCRSRELPVTSRDRQRVPSRTPRVRPRVSCCLLVSFINLRLLAGNGQETCCSG